MKGKSMNKHDTIGDGLLHLFKKLFGILGVVITIIFSEFEIDIIYERNLSL